MTYYDSSIYIINSLNLKFLYDSYVQFCSCAIYFAAVIFFFAVVQFVFRVGYRFGFFGWYLVGISWFLPNRYRRKTRSVHFSIIILAGTPFFLERGVTAPFFRGPDPILRKKGFPAKPLRVPAKFFSAWNTNRNTDRPAPVYGISIPMLAKLPVSKWYPTLFFLQLYNFFAVVQFTSRPDEILDNAKMSNSTYVDLELKKRVPLGWFPSLSHPNQGTYVSPPHVTTTLYMVRGDVP